MDIAGIVSEYNPFHAGHLHHIEETRRLLGGEAGIICVMSGNFVQRGSPAIAHKLSRARAAAECGADVVLELPVFCALAPAELFASGAVGLLKACGVVSHLSFGSECGSVAAIEAAAARALTPEYSEGLRAALKSGAPYARAAAEAFGPGLAPVCESPNNLLGIEYVKALRGSGIAPLTVLRKGAAHDSSEAAGGLLSASAIRALLAAGKMPPIGALPEASLRAIERERGLGRFPVLPPAFESAVLASVLRAGKEGLRALPEVGEGLENRIFDAAFACHSVDSLLKTVKTRRYSLARLRRVLFTCLLGITRDTQRQRPAYLRVLAASPRGVEILAEMRERALLPVVTKPAAVKKLGPAARAQAELEATADRLYAMGFPSSECAGETAFYRATPYVGVN